MPTRSPSGVPVTFLCALFLFGCSSEDVSSRATAGSAGNGGKAGSGGTAGSHGSGAASAGGTGGASGSAGGGSSGSSGAAGAAGSVGVAGSAGAGAGGGAAFSCDGRTICEDFEDISAGQQPGAPFNPYVFDDKGTIVVDDTRAMSGARSMKVTIDATTDSDTYRVAMLQVKGAPLLPATNNNVYGRFMIWTDRIPDSSVHWTIAHGGGVYTADGKYANYNYGGMGNLMANYYRDTANPSTDCWQTKDEDFATNDWVCVGFQFDGANNEMRYWQDGVEIPELHVVGEDKTIDTCVKPGGVSPADGRWWAPTAFDNISIGWESYQHDTAGAHSAWIDDIVLDDQPIPCP